jgi:glyoxylase-like metal-dependent hydrolase (beta-lactamase superfamily II)
MRIVPLHRDDPSGYSCCAYWILGENNTAEDRNTLVDTGSADPANLGYFLDEMATQSKGIGKKAVERVILTHAHFDHAGGLPGIVAQFDPDLYAWLPLDRPSKPIRNGMALMVGDRMATLIHTPGHSDDSICVFLPDSGTLFSGDTLYRISDHQGAYPRAYARSLERLAGLAVRTILPGHGRPIVKDAMGFIHGCLDNVRQSRLQD